MYCRTNSYSILNVEGKDIEVAKYREMAEQSGNSIPPRCFEDDGVTVNLDKAQRAFWRGMTTTADCPMYGADVSVSLFVALANVVLSLMLLSRKGHID
jgi:hypothetical protein